MNQLNLNVSADVAKLIFADLPVGFSVIPNEPELLPRPPMTASEILENDSAESWTKIVASSV